MRSFIDQDDLATYVRERLRAQLESAASHIDGLNEEDLTLPRSDGGWGPAAILDHLAVMNGLYLAKLERAIATASPAPRRDWKPSLAGRLLHWGVTTSLKMKTPTIFKPENPRSDASAYGRFRSAQESLLRVLDSASDLHWQTIRISSPAFERLKFNLGDVFLVLADHGDRHLSQLESLAVQRKAERGT